MGALWRIVLALAAAEAGVWRSHVAGRAGLVVALAVFAVLALGFGLALGVVALAAWIGLIDALAVALGVAILGCLVVLILLRIEARNHAVERARQAAERKRMIETALVLALPGLKVGSALALGIAALMVSLLTGGKGGKDGD